MNFIQIPVKSWIVFDFLVFLFHKTEWKRIKSCSRSTWTEFQLILVATLLSFAIITVFFNRFFSLVPMAFIIIVENQLYYKENFLRSPFLEKNSKNNSWFSFIRLLFLFLFKRISICFHFLIKCIYFIFVINIIWLLM